MVTDTKITALHEAAHAVVQYRVAGDFGDTVSIVPHAGNLGMVTDYFTDSGSQDDLRARILSCYAGGEADRRNGCYDAVACSQDEESAAECLRLLGLQDQGPAMRAESRRLVDLHWPEIEAVAEELLERRKLDGTEVVFIADIAAGSDEIGLTDLAEYRALIFQKLTD